MITLRLKLEAFLYSSSLAEFWVRECVNVYKVLSSAGGVGRRLRLLRTEKHIELREVDRRSMIEYVYIYQVYIMIVVANW